jgi:hypothetical protein
MREHQTSPPLGIGKHLMPNAAQNNQIAEIKLSLKLLPIRFIAQARRHEALSIGNLIMA